MNKIVNIKLAFRQAENIARKRLSKAWVMSGILFQEEEQDIGILSMDVYRLKKNGIFSEKELTCYISLQNKAMFGLVHSFMFPDDSYDYKNLGELLWYAGTLRDYFKDLEDGYVNISGEDIELYNINVNNPEDEYLHIWLSEKIPPVLKLLDREILILKKMPLKVRIFWAFAYPFYLQKILRIKIYNYSYDYENHKNLIKELRTYLAALFLGSKTVLRILFR